MATCTAPNDYVWGQWVRGQWVSDTTSSASDNAWYYWNDTGTTYSTTASTISTASDVIWYNWSKPREYDRTVEVTVSDQTGVVWKGWVDEYEARSKESYRAVFRDTINEGLKKIKQPSIETLRAQKAQQEIRKIWSQMTADEKAAEQQAAEVVAKDLLLDLISEEEFKRYESTGMLIVKGKVHDYVIKKNGSVYRMDKGKIIEFAKKKVAKGKFICVHPRRSTAYPETDNVITLKMWIEGNEKEFLNIGNKHDYENDLEEFDKVVGI